MSIINAIESGDNTELAAFLREIYRRAMTDADFRETALNDPEAAFEAVGGSLKNWSIKFVDSEEGIDDVFMLPPSVNTASELSEEDSKPSPEVPSIPLTTMKAVAPLPPKVRSWCSTSPDAQEVSRGVGIMDVVSALVSPFAVQSLRFICP
jgi:hypothetical protein